MPLLLFTKFFFLKHTFSLYYLAYFSETWHGGEKLWMGENTTHSVCFWLDSRLRLKHGAISFLRCRCNIHDSMITIEVL